MQITHRKFVDSCFRKSPRPSALDRTFIPAFTATCGSPPAQIAAAPSTAYTAPSLYSPHYNACAPRPPALPATPASATRCARQCCPSRPPALPTVVACAVVVAPPAPCTCAAFDPLCYRATSAARLCRAKVGHPRYTTLPCTSSNILNHARLHHSPCPVATPTHVDVAAAGRHPPPLRAPQCLNQSTLSTPSNRR